MKSCVMLAPGSRRRSISPLTGSTARSTPSQVARFGDPRAGRQDQRIAGMLAGLGAHRATARRPSWRRPLDRRVHAGRAGLPRAFGEREHERADCAANGCLRSPALPAPPRTGAVRSIAIPARSRRVVGNPAWPANRRAAASSSCAILLVECDQHAPDRRDPVRRAPAAPRAPAPSFDGGGTTRAPRARDPAPAARIGFRFPGFLPDAWSPIRSRSISVVAGAGSRQVIGDGTAKDASADDDDVQRFHAGPLTALRSCRHRS